MVTIFFGWGIPVWSQYKDLRPNVDGSTEGKTKGGSAHESFPEVDLTRGQVNSKLQVRASVLSLLIAGMTHKYPKSM